MSVIFLFVDGVGMGEDSPQNPLTNESLQGFQFMSDNQPFTKKVQTVKKNRHFLTQVDATLGVPGLPQSGTGQTALFTGENAPKKIGKHFGPYPHSGVQPLLKEKSIFKKAKSQWKTCTFINAYPEIFFKKNKQRNRWTCTTLMTKSAEIRLNGESDIQNETALTAGLTQESWHKNLNKDVPIISPEDAADRLIKQSVNYDLLLHEFYLTDKAGHDQQKNAARRILERYDRFLFELIQENPASSTIVLCSDHGNIEDLSTKTHTLNKVPLFAYGPGAAAFEQAKSIMDVTPAILKVL
jgi:hypothetical protein